MTRPLQRWLRDQSFLILILIGSFVLGVPQFDSRPAGAFFDDAHYIILAESLVSGQGYRLTNFPNAPVENAFPPGWPLLLTPLVALFPRNYLVLKAFAFLLWLGCLPLVDSVLGRRLPGLDRKLLLGLVAFSPAVLGLAVTPMSEAAYLFFSLLTLNVVEIWWQEKRQVRWLVLAFALALCTIAVRTIGITLLCGMLLFLLFKGNWRTIGVVLAVVLLGLLPIAWFNLQQGGFLVFSPTYQAHVDYVITQSGRFLRFWQEIPRIDLESIASTVIPLFDLPLLAVWFSPALNRLLSGLALLVLLGGFGLALRRYRVAELYVLLYLLILYLWFVYVERVQPRLLIPIVPFAYFYLIVALRWFVARLPRLSPPQKDRVLGGGVVGLIVLLMVRNVGRWDAAPPARYIAIQAGAEWAHVHTPAAAILMSTAPEFTYLYARRPTVFAPGEEGVDLASYIATTGADYIILRPELDQTDLVERPTEQIASAELLSFLQADPAHYRPVYDDEAHNVRVY